MKCSHGFQLEVKCRKCFEEGMERVSASRQAVAQLRDVSEARVLAPYPVRVDVTPREVYTKA